MGCASLCRSGAPRPWKCPPGPLGVDDKSEGTERRGAVSHRRERPVARSRRAGETGCCVRRLSATWSAIGASPRSRSVDGADEGPFVSSCQERRYALGEEWIRADVDERRGSRIPPA
jgi:hypothetical protein